MIDTDDHVVFSPRENELVPMLARGLTSKQCAEAMGVSEATIKGLSDALRYKLRVRTRRQIPDAYWKVTGTDPYPSEA